MYFELCLVLYVTGFVKRGLPHTLNLPTLMTHNFGLVNAIALIWSAGRWIPGQKFQLRMLLDASYDLPHL